MGNNQTIVRYVLNRKNVCVCVCLLCLCFIKLLATKCGDWWSVCVEAPWIYQAFHPFWPPEPLNCLRGLSCMCTLIKTKVTSPLSSTSALLFTWETHLSRNTSAKKNKWFVSLPRGALKEKKSTKQKFKHKQRTNGRQLNHGWCRSVRSFSDRPSSVFQSLVGNVHKSIQHPCIHWHTRAHSKPTELNKFAWGYDLMRSRSIRRGSCCTSFISIIVSRLFY